VTETGTSFELAHVLFVDVVGYSKLLLEEQREALRELKVIVRGTEQFRLAEARNQLVCLPTGDGMVLAFFTTPEAPVRCAIEVARALQQNPALQLRMGIHSGPVSRVADVNEGENIAGAGINMAQRVMDCGDAGHILLSKRVAEDLAESREWKGFLRDLGECEVKHGVKLHLFNFFGNGFGNSAAPTKIAAKRALAMDAGGHSRRLPFAIAGIILLSIIAIGWWWSDRPSHRGEQLAKPAEVVAPEKSIAVLPFENLSDDKSTAYFVDGIHEEILTRLAKVADIKVISRTSTQQFRSKPENLSEIAKQLGVAHILEGSAQRAADQVRVNVQLINATTDAHMWAETYDRKLTDVFAVETEIATKVADTLQARLTGAQRVALAAHPTENMQAHELYLKGRFFWNKRTGDDLQKSIEYFNQAIAADPNYALAYAGIADAYAVLPALTSSSPQDYFSKAKAAVKKALELDDSLAEAHASLAACLCYFDLDYSQAGKEFERAIELDPNYATAHQWYGIVFFAALGRSEEAVVELKRALVLDPLSLIINTDLGRVYYFARRNDESIEQLRKTLEMDRNFYFAHRNLGCALEMKGDFEGALREYAAARALNDDARILALLGHAYAASGNRSEAVKMLDQMKVESKDRYVPAYSFALVYLGLGDKEEALRWLERSYQEHFPEITRIKIEPLLDPLRGDPRFEALANKVVPQSK
jgi:TolB-like protein/Tfp pilus assembly protein PilF